MWAPGAFPTGDFVTRPCVMATADCYKNIVELRNAAFRLKLRGPVVGATWRPTRLVRVRLYGAEWEASSDGNRCLSRSPSAPRLLERSLRFDTCCR